MFKKLDELEHLQGGKFFQQIGKFSDLPTFTKIPKFYLPGPRNVRSFSPNGERGKFSNLEKSENFLPKFDELEYLQ